MCIRDSLHDDHVIRGNRARQPDRPIAVHQAQVFDEHEVGNHARVDDHRQRDAAQNRITPQQPLFGQRIGGADRTQHADQGAYQRENDGVLHRHEDRRGLRHAHVGIGRKRCV